MVAVDAQLGREEPSVSMDGAGKIVYARNAEILTATLQASAGTSTSPIRMDRANEDAQTRRFRTDRSSQSLPASWATRRSTPRRFSTVPTAGTFSLLALLLELY